MKIITSLLLLGVIASFVVGISLGHLIAMKSTARVIGSNYCYEYGLPFEKIDEYGRIYCNNGGRYVLFPDEVGVCNQLKLLKNGVTEGGSVSMGLLNFTE